MFLSVARLHDAAVTPEAWPDTLTALTDAAGVAGVFGIHQQIGRSFSDSVDSIVNLAGIPLKHAAWRHIERLCSPRSAIFDLSQTELSAEASRCFISKLTTAAGILTKPDRFFRRPMTQRRMPLLLPKNSRKMAAGTDLPFS